MSTTTIHQLIRSYSATDPAGRAGLYRRWLQMPLYPGDDKGRADLERLLLALPDDAARDLGLARAVTVMFEFAGAEAKAPEGAMENSIQSAVLGAEFHTVAQELTDWIKRTYTVDADTSPTDTLFRARNASVEPPAPPVITLGRFGALLASHYHVDRTKEWWVAEAFHQWVDEYANVWPILSLWLTGWIADDQNVERDFGHIPGVYIDFAAEWCATGFPQLILHQPLAAAFALTDVPQSMIAGCQLPWTAFRVMLPKTPIVMQKNGADVEIFDELWCWQTTLRASDESESGLWMLGGRSERTRDGVTTRGWFQLLSRPSALADLCSLPAQARDALATEFGADRAEVARGYLQSLLNIALCAVLHLAAGHHERAPAKKAPKGQRWRAPKSAPVTTDFVLGHDVKISGPNLAPVVTAMCNGSRKFGKVQWVVRGHQRWQAHGPRHTLRKLIWVPPYWKGPIDAPILKRSHEVEDAP